MSSIMATARHIFRSFVILSLFLAVGTAAATDHHSPSFVQYTRTDGLASNIVAGAAKDARGFLWIATPDGIQRFDGTTFQTFRYTPSEAAELRGVNYLSCFAMDSNRILFFEFSGRIDQYNYRTGRVENFSRLAGLDSIGAVSAFRDSRGRLWIATRNGVALIDDTGRLGKEYIIAKDLPDETQDNQVNLIREDFSGRLWLAMYGKGIFLFDPVEHRFSAPLKRSLYDVQVHDLSFSSDRRTVWAATGGNGVLKIDAATFRMTNITASLPAPLSAMKAVPSIHLYKDSVVWIGTLNGTIEYSIAERSAILHTNDPHQTASLSNNMVLFIAGFRDELLWFGTQKGLNKLSVAPSRFRRTYHDPNDITSLSTNAVNHQWEDPDGNQWFATARGLSIRSAAGRFYPYALSPSGDAIAIHIADDPDRNIWIGTWGSGLMRTKIPRGFVPGDPLTFEMILGSQFIKKTIVDASGDIIAVSWGGGIHSISKKERSAPRPHVWTLRKGLESGLSSNHIADICPDGKGTYWISTGNGLQYWDRIMGTFRTFYADTADKEQPINRPTYIAKDSLGTVWVGTQGGLVSIDAREHGLPHLRIRLRQEGMFVYQPQIDTGSTLWFGAPHSQLIEFNTHNGETRIYDLTNEMNGYEFNFGHSSILRNGSVAMCGTDGVLQFTPGTLRSVSAVPTLYRTSIMIEGTLLQAGMDHSCVTQLETSFDRSSLSISYAALNFEHPERVRYEYQLEGTNGGWVPAGNRTAVAFANLSPGSYRFRVRASNDNRSWSTEAEPLSIVVTPPWWETPLVRFSAAVVIALLSVLVVQRKFRQLKQEQERQQQFSKQLIDSQEAERKRIASELHDGIGQNLLIISNTLQMYLGAKRKKNEEIEQVTELTKETVREIRTISSNLHPHQLERLGLNRALRSMVESAGKGSGIAWSVTIQEGVVLRRADQEIHIYRIVQEIVNNIVKHSGASSAGIAFTATNSHIQITAQDNGKGFTVHAPGSDGFGMTSLKERTRLLNGTLTVVSSPGSGTQLTITLPNNG
jgi:signal transduction histidine kinase/ligand-binding sensor domain-containing protein